ncbi:MAG: glycosyltransferase family 39 protein [Anaerolineales bacterium]|nr:glycosyltransferase family 39 protein [Anaerolineales bacterium]
MGLFSRSPQRLNFNYIFICLLFILHGCFLIWNIDRIEFFGEDEVGTALVNARVILGLTSGNIYNVAAPVSSSHPPVRNLVQIPFMGLFGVNELSIFLPGILASLGIFWVVLKIGRLFLNKSGMICLGLLYCFSAAYVINRSPNAHGLFILFVLLSFLYTERYRENQRLALLVFAWLFLACATLTYLEGILFAPLILACTLKPGLANVQNRKIMIRQMSSVLAYAIPLTVYFLVFWIAPAILLNKPVGNVIHVFQRGGTLGFTPENVGAFFANYYFTFSPFFAPLLLCAVLAIFSRSKPAILIRLLIYFSLHLILWLLFFTNECGHTLYDYPVFMFFSAYALQEIFEGIKNKPAKVILVTIISIFLLGSALYNITAYSDPTPRKSIIGYHCFEDHLPCGVNYAHQVGLKSAAYWLRQNSASTDLYVGDVGESMNLFYLDRKSAKLTIEKLIDRLETNPDMDLYAQYSIRYIGLTTSSENYSQRAALLDCMYKPVLKVIQEDGQVLMVVWDTQRDNAPNMESIQVNQFTRAFDHEYDSPGMRFASWIDYWPGKFHE